MDSWIHWFSGSLIHWLTESVIHCFVDSLIHRRIHSFVRSFVPSFIQSVSQWLIHGFMDSSALHSCVDSFSHCFTESPVYWAIGSLNHRFIDSWVHCCIDSQNHCWFIDSSAHYFIQWCTGSLIQWFISSLNILALIHWIIDSLVRWYIESSIHWFIDLLNHRSIDSLNHSESSVRWFIDSIKSWNHWFIDSSAHEFTFSLIHCHFIRISTTICSFVVAPCTFSRSLILHRKNFRPLVSYSHFLFSKLPPLRVPGTIWYKQNVSKWIRTIEQGTQVDSWAQPSGRKRAAGPVSFQLLVKRLSDIVSSHNNVSIQRAACSSATSSSCPFFVSAASLWNCLSFHSFRAAARCLDLSLCKISLLRRIFFEVPLSVATSSGAGSFLFPSLSLHPSSLSYFVFHLQARACFMNP